MSCSDATGPVRLIVRGDSGGDVRILFVIDSLGAGGAERSLTELLEPLQARGVDSVVACLERRPVGFHEEVEASHEVIVLQGQRDVGRVGALRALVDRFQPQIVHSTLIRSDLVARAAVLGHASRHVTSLVNTTYDAGRLLDPQVNRLGLGAFRQIDGFTARHVTDRFHAITRSVAESNIQALGLSPERVEVVERGRDPLRLGVRSEARRTSARAALAVNPTDQVVVHIGRQESQKGLIDLVRAIGRLRRDGRNAVLLQAGRAGHDTAAIEAAVAAEGVGGHVRFLGHREDVAEVLAAGDIFAFPSIYEGLGGSVIEAMALGLPIVATRIPALVETLEEGRNACFVPVNDPVALAEALGTLIDSQVLRDQWGRHSRKIFEEKYTLVRSADRMVAFYERSLTERPARRWSWKGNVQPAI